MLCVALVGLAVSGCGPGRADRVAVSGQVLIDGQPLTFGSIRFLPKGPGRVAFATLDKQGHFDFGNEGVQLGMNRVEVIVAEQVNEADYKWHAPQKYMSAETSGLTQEITGPVNDLVIRLEWGTEKPHTVRGSAVGDDPKNLKRTR
ncbi:MAG: hypothetical protein IT425_11510 [Pirellulales bacterium]|nr:hypothetical protein [Pirellulales bacterium]